MSWIEKNYEKAALGGAVVVALGLTYMGWSKLAAVQTEFDAPFKGTGNSNAAVKDADLVSKAVASRKIDRTVKQGLDGDRPVDLFTGVPLFVSSSAPEEPLDPVTGEPIHPPIPNVWWLTNHIDPGYGDSPARDPDSDGFSNLEEFLAKTDPNDSSSFPSLIAKLKYVKDEALTWVLIPRFEDQGKFPFNYEDSARGTNKATAANPVAPGDLFFATGTMANRFKFLGSEVRKQMQASTKQEVDVTITRIEDQRPNKKGRIYEFPAPLSDQRKNEYVQYDRTAVFSLEALGNEGKEFKVEENTSFALPAAGTKKDYLLKEVTPDSVTVEYTAPGGEKKTATIKKGSLPQMTE